MQIKGFFSIWNHDNVLVSTFDSFEYLCFYSYSAGIDFRRHNQQSTDVWRLRGIPAL